MTIRPVDMKTLMPKTQQLSKMQQMENDKQKSFAYFQNNDQAKKTEKELRQVRNSEKMSKAKITKDNKKREHNTKQKDKDNNNSNAHEEKDLEKGNVDGVLGFNIDIKI
ncbi:hypothetical protein [Brassicibacter mesophilus]|jgi:hypothetical protein|uniref:hypothetical protein n=1 Tax=Brassicibacter mesophilus TaxID=745119 RepID=UPI003D1CBA1D